VTSPNSTSVGLIFMKCCIGSPRLFYAVYKGASKIGIRGLAMPTKGRTRHNCQVRHAYVPQLMSVTTPSVSRDWAPRQSRLDPTRAGSVRNATGSWFDSQGGLPLERTVATPAEPYVTAQSMDPTPCDHMVHICSAHFSSLTDPPSKESLTNVYNIHS
jgi:hypothetical protein